MLDNDTPTPRAPSAGSAAQAAATNLPNEVSMHRSLDRLSDVFEASAKRWEVIVYPTLLAFIILAAYGFYLIYSLTRDVQKVANNMNEITLSISAVANNMHGLSQDMAVVAASIQEQSSALTQVALSMQATTDTMEVMNVTLTRMNQHMGAMSQGVGTMNQSVGMMNQSMRPMSFFNGFMPW